MRTLNLNELTQLLWECLCSKKEGVLLKDELTDALPEFCKILHAESTQIAISDNVDIEAIMHVVHGFCMNSLHRKDEPTPAEIANMILYSSLFSLTLGVYLAQESKVSIAGESLQ